MTYKSREEISKEKWTSMFHFFNVVQAHNKILLQFSGVWVAEILH